MAFAVTATSCKKNNSTPADAEVSLTRAPTGFPAIPFPEDNPFTKEKWELGRKLFYDKILSSDNTVSCGSCHNQPLGFSDNISLSKGAANADGVTNSPTLTNVAYQPYYTRPGNIPTLEMQILIPIQEHNELNSNIVDIAERLKKIPDYVNMSQKAFGKEPDPYVITRALATFERTLVSGNSEYDKYIRGDKSFNFPEAAIRGKNLFFSSRTNCSKCHSGCNFTDYSFKNNGLYESYTDSGRARVTRKKEDRALFKVPTLRNVATTAPYMHDGSLPTLQSVIEHYNKGGAPHINRSALIRPLGLSQAEQRDLIAFLESLTDKKFITNPAFAE